MTARPWSAPIGGPAVDARANPEDPRLARISSLAGRPPGRSRDRSQSGQGLVEYGLILVIMAVACVVSLVFFGDQLSSLFSLIASAV